MKYSLRSLMIVGAVLPPLVGMAVYYGGLVAALGIVCASVCLTIAIAGRAMAV